MIASRIRRATTEELPGILRIEKRSFGIDAWSSEQFLEYLSRPSRSIFLIWVSGSVAAGYVLAAVRGTRLDIDSVAVDPRFRGKGIATALLKRAIATARRRGFTAVSLSVRRDNEAAIHLYRKLGFAPVRRIENYYEDGAPAWRMTLKLAAFDRTG